MKHLNILILIPFLLFLVSCSTATNISVAAEPGTQIMTVGKTVLATAGPEGKATISLSDETYRAFLLSHKPGTDEYVPFALDYHFKKHNDYNNIGPALAKILFWSSAGVGAIMGIAGAAGGVPEIAISGAAEMGIGLAAAIPLTIAAKRSDQSAFSYQYEYEYNQRSNEDIRVQKIVIDVPTDAGISSTATFFEEKPSSSALQVNEADGVTLNSLVGKYYRIKYSEVDGMFLPFEGELHLTANGVVISVGDGNGKVKAMQMYTKNSAVSDVKWSIKSWNSTGTIEMSPEYTNDNPAAILITVTENGRTNRFVLTNEPKDKSILEQ